MKTKDEYSLADKKVYSLSLDKRDSLDGVYSDGDKGLHKPSESSIEGQKTFTVRGNLDKVFNGCLKVLQERVKIREYSEILEVESPQSIKALIGGSEITVEIKQVRMGMVEIYFQSSNSWDFGTDRKNVDIFEKLILEELHQ